MKTPDETTAAEPALTQENADADSREALTNLGDTARASWPFSTDTIRANLKHEPAETRELIVWAFTWCTDTAHSIRMDDFCDRVGYSRNTVWKILSGRYTHPETKTVMVAPEPLLKAIRNFRKIEIAREKLGRASFVMTPTAKKLFLACDLARESQTPVFVYGASQIGKTEALRQYCIENNHGRSVLVELEAVNGLKGMLQAIAEKVGVSPHANTPQLIERIKKAITRDMVIVLDEVHLLANVYRKGSFFACMETVRRLLCDHCQCGLVLTFTLIGYGKAESERKRELEQIFRRGVHRVHLGEMPTVADVGAIVRAWGLEMPAASDEISIPVGRAEHRERPREMPGLLAREHGLKAIIERLRYGQKIAAEKEKDLTWEHVVLADLLIRKNATAPVHGWDAKGGAA